MVEGHKVPQGSPDCWQATYTGDGAALIWICRYGAGNGVSSFDAWQRVRGDSRTVKFQEGPYLVLVKGSDAPKAELLALILGGHPDPANGGQVVTQNPANGERSFPSPTHL